MSQRKLVEEGDCGALPPGLRERTFGDEVVKEATLGQSECRWSRHKSLGSLDTCYALVTLCRELLLVKASVGQAQGCRWGEPREVENAGDSFLCFSAEWTKGGGRHPTTRSPILKNSWRVSQQDRCHRNVKIKEQGTRTEFRERWIPSSC